MKNGTHEYDDDEGQLQVICSDGDEEDDGTDDDD